VKREEQVVIGIGFAGVAEGGAGTNSPPHQVLIPGVIFCVRGGPSLCASFRRPDFDVLIQRACNVPGRTAAGFTGFGKSSPFFAQSECD